MEEKAGESQKRPFLGIMFECCSLYRRIYRNKEGKAYTGCCPRCLRQVVVKVEEGGSGARFFRVR